MAVINVPERPIDGCNTKRLAKFSTVLPAFPRMNHFEATLYMPGDGCDMERLAKFVTSLPAFPYMHHFEATSWAYRWVSHGKASEI